MILRIVFSFLLLTSAVFASENFNGQNFVVDSAKSFNRGVLRGEFAARGVKLLLSNGQIAIASCGALWNSKVLSIHFAVQTPNYYYYDADVEVFEPVMSLSSKLESGQACQSQLLLLATPQAAFSLSQNGKLIFTQSPR